ncbi:unnamed protein product, partial [Brachionus calyciflorus]
KLFPMSRRIFLNAAEPQGFPFIFGHPYFQAANSDDLNEVYEIHNPGSDLNLSKDNLSHDSEIDDMDTKELVDKNEKYATSLSSDRLRIDPNYKWLLKDLHLNNDTRVIDVTDILEDNNNENRVENEIETDKKETIEEKIELKNAESELKTEKDMDVIEQENDPVQLFYPQNSINDTSRDLDDETINTNETLEAKDFSDDDHKDDHYTIEKLYAKLVKPVNDAQNETLDESDYENESVISEENNQFQNETPCESDNEEPIKKNSKFSKSFEVSLSSMDNLIDRIDNGMKLKRNKAPEKCEKESSSNKILSENSEEGSSKIVESLKQEWSNMFNKLENDYKNKLDEQQKLNDMKLKSLHEEIKKSMVEQEKILFKKINPDVQKEFVEEKKVDLKSTIVVSDVSNKSLLVDVSTSTSDMLINSSTLTDNAKYISNLRAELKAKHSRHVQDLRDYYDKEIEDLRKKIEIYESKFGTDIENADTFENRENELKMKYEQLSSINTDLKESNASLIHKLEECNDHINYLKQENYELSNNFGQVISKLKYAEDKIKNLQEGYDNLEAQLGESLKVQDNFGRELQIEKRNLIKKVQENEDLQMNIKYYEQKCETYELKLDEKDSIITRLKSKLAQSELDFNRLEYEFQKLKNSSKLSDLNPSSQKSYSNSMQETNQGSPLQIPIKTQNRYSSVQNISGLNTSPKNLSPRKQSPPHNQPLTILCNLNTHQTNNNQYSSSSSSSKSPVTHRSRSPAHKSGNTQSDNLIKYQNHLNQQQPQHHYMENENLVVNHSAPFQAYNRKSLQSNTKLNNSNLSTPLQSQQQKGNISNAHQSFKISDLTPDKQIKYIEKLENEFDQLMKQRQQLDAKLTRLPYKATNPSMHAIRESVEEELNVVEKKIASVKLELRKLNIIKTH